MGIWGHAPPENFQSKEPFKYAKNEFHSIKFPDFPMTFGILGQFP